MICGCIGIVAESSYEALKKRYDQGWVLELIEDLDVLIRRVIEAKNKREVQYGEAKLIPFMYTKGINFASPYCNKIYFFSLNIELSYFHLTYFHS